MLGYVAIKIQHANVLRHSALDILTVKHLVDLVQWIYPEVQLKWLADEMATNLPKEMNFVQEGENAERMSASSSASFQTGLVASTLSMCLPSGGHAPLPEYSSWN